MGKMFQKCHGAVLSLPVSKSRRCGFTLIELLVVIAIIALLLSILLPSLSKVKKQAGGVICRTQMKDIGTST